MIDKTATDAATAVACIPDGATVMVAGFGESGRPNTLLKALLASGATGLTVISNNAGEGTHGMAGLLLAGRVSKLICSFPRGDMAAETEKLVRAGKLTLEVMPQGTLAERIRAAGCGIGAFYTPTSYGTDIGAGKEAREIDGVMHVLEYALKADYALVKARHGDRWGNLDYSLLSRNFAPLMCAGAAHTIVEVDEIVPLGAMDPENVVTPGIFTNALVLTGSRTEPHGTEALA
ncbi:MAG: 3-oxoadipate CoA-transferase alpha subunit [Paracoccaceae bacterium]|jgi:3-oxoadipate CoA-transferase alpha subunit